MGFLRDFASLSLVYKYSDSIIFIFCCQFQLLVLTNH